MVIRVAINGFGRIGRLTLREILETKRSEIEVVAINDLGSAETNAFLFKHDSVHGTYKGNVEVKGNAFVIDGKEIKVVSEKDPTQLPWKSLNIDVVYECTGRFTTKEKASAHITAGAKKVLISAPGDGVDLTVVYGVNHEKLTKEHTVVSNASCTTNCLAPVAWVLNNGLGIERGFCTTIHSYTGDQNLVDSMHSDLRRSRAAAMSIIPSSTGAAKAVGLVMPELKGKLDGAAIRVPTPNVSLIDFKFTSKKHTSVEEVNKLMIEASKGKLKGVLEICDQPLVSIDFNHNPASSIFDLTQTQVIDGVFVRVVSWYDNEFGFSSRMSDVAIAWMKA